MLLPASAFMDDSIPLLTVNHEGNPVDEVPVFRIGIGSAKEGDAERDEVSPLLLPPILN